MGVASHPAGGPPHDERDLRVDLEGREPGDHVNPRRLEALGPADVELFVEPRLELHEYRDVGPAGGRAAQRIADRRGPAGAIQRQFDRCDAGIVRCFGNEALERGREGVVRMVDEDVASVERFDDRAVVGERILGDEWRIVEVRPGEPSGELPERAQIHEARSLVHIRGAEGALEIAFLEPQLAL